MEFYGLYERKGERDTWNCDGTLFGSDDLLLAEVLYPPGSLGLVVGQFDVFIRESSERQRIPSGLLRS